MKRITLYRFGPAASELRELENHYLKLIARYAKVEVRTLKDPGCIVSEEHLPAGDLIILSEHGREYTTAEFSDLVFAGQQTDLTFVLGNAFGFDAELRKSAKMLSLSKLTIAHDLAWAVFLEQLYRAGNLHAGGHYHK
ncbi:MAG: Ribosomal RNA large subunit methyltransferase H [candidate division WS6 bacterium OLB20]|uniref:Ribosomal RNA large subunit methyltransferase H n=1 Tax=candidate division WS6 bacterium OLB20 TaxID=1617426 RepID=A0A136M0I1_9BACT|nr:MAG: Ribosomal RNA large subunit methyltransferase H [candidate division WS6 bacterium OLB20]